MTERERERERERDFSVDVYGRNVLKKILKLDGRMH
jgi:hypothetical protein